MPARRLGVVPARRLGAVAAAAVQLQYWPVQRAARLCRAAGAGAGGGGGGGGGAPAEARGPAGPAGQAGQRAGAGVGAEGGGGARSTPLCSPLDPREAGRVLRATTRITTRARVVAVGDVHGDFQKTVGALSVAGVLDWREDGQPQWVGGDTVLVQVGDVLDRGDREIAIISLLQHLQRQAEEAGGRVLLLNGNHEALNVLGDFRYVTPGGFAESSKIVQMSTSVPDDVTGTWEGQLRARLALFSPGGPVANQLAKNYTVLQVNDTVFAHGGLRPAHVEYGIEKMNEEVSNWMAGVKTEGGARFPPPMDAMGSGDSVMWNRSYSKEEFDNPVERYHAANMLQQTLDKLGAARLVVGHTPQFRGVNDELGGRIWRVDVGMSSGVLGARPQVMEILPSPSGGASQINILS